MFIGDLPEHPVILPDMSTFTGRIIKHLFEERGLGLNVAMATNYLETIKMLVSVGLGWSVLPRSMLDDTIKIIDVPNINIERQLGIIHHIQRTLSNAGLAFLELLKEQSTLQQSTVQSTLK